MKFFTGGFALNILIFGPNGSGKGTQGSLAKKKYDLDHIESGAIFRKHIGGGTELGKKAKYNFLPFCKYFMRIYL